jgi:hypothetical protein
VSVIVCLSVGWGLSIVKQQRGALVVIGPGFALEFAPAFVV